MIGDMRNRIASLLAAALLLSGCGNSSSSSMTRRTIPSSESSQTPSSAPSSDTSETSTSSAESESSSESESTSSEEEVRASDLTAEQYSLFLQRFFQKRNSYDSYQAITAGKTATIVDQSIDVTVIKGKEYSYLYNHSKSFFLETAHTCYFHGEKTLSKNKDDRDFALLDLNEYLDIYGVYPFENSLEGYECSGQAILSINKENAGDNTIFTFNFDPEKATTNVRIQMKKFGNLGDYPKFSSVKVSVTVQDDFTPVTIDVDTQYKAKMVFETDCHQTYKVTYSRFNEEIEIPDLDMAKSHEGF